MSETWDNEYKNMWDNRYRDQEYAYGREPNIFFKEWLEKFDPGSILMPADGEGRNGVFAAQLGWNVTAFDLSIEGKAKALALAKSNLVTIEYIVGDLEHLKFENQSFDAIGLIYAHFAAEKKSVFHRKLSNYLKRGGVVILEAFNKEHLQLKKLDPKIGGPQDFDMLMSGAELLADFDNYNILLLEEKEISVTEGKFHIGKGSVVRFVARKP